MKRVFIALLFLLCANILPANNAVAKKRYKAEGANAKQIDSLYFIEPVLATINTKAGNPELKNDPGGAKAILVAKKVILNYAARIKIAREITFNDSLLKKRVAAEVFQLMIDARNSKQLGNSIFPGTIDSIMDAGNRRFLLLEMNTGNLLPEENAKRRKQLNRLGQTYGLVGAVVANSEAEYHLLENRMQLMILDARENRIYFYNEDNSHFESHKHVFTDFDDQLTQFRLLFEGFFFSKPSLERS